jgi:hypothetical protein
MTSEELAAEVGLAIGRVQGRVLGVGRDQYDDGSGVQPFERKEPGEIIRWAIEEADDLIAYGVMLGIRLRALAAVVERVAA